MAAMDEPSVMFSDLFKWIPRWRDKVVIELWSMGTFMRLDWSEKHQAVVAAKAKEDNEKTWKAMQEETRKNLDQERLEKGAASRQHAARIAEASQERAAKAEEQRKKQLDQTIEVRFNEESKQAYYESKTKAHAEDEAKAQRFERQQRSKREHGAAERLTEKIHSAEEMARERQRAAMTEVEGQARQFQSTLRARQEEKRQQLFDNVAREEADQRTLKKEGELMFQKDLSAQHNLEARRQAQQAANAHAATEVLMERWDDETKRRLERRHSFDQRSAAMRNAAIGKNDFRLRKDVEVAQLQHALAEREQSIRLREEGAAKQRMEAARASRVAQAHALRAAEQLKSEHEQRGAEEESRHTKKSMREETARQEAEAAQRHAALAEFGQQQRREAEAKRLEAERVHAAIQKRCNAELDGILKRKHKARQDYREASSPLRDRPSPSPPWSHGSPVQFMPGVSPVSSPLTPM